MLKYLCLPAILALSACGGVGEPSQGLTATYDQSLSRSAFDQISRTNTHCDNHQHHDACDVQTDVRDHVSPGPRGHVVRVISGTK